MALPASFVKDGFYNPNKPKARKRLLIGSDGWRNSGKTEFIMSCPGPTIVIALDRGHESCLDNPEPPAWRRDDVVFVTIKIPTATQSYDTKFFMEYWNLFKATLYKALDNPDAATVAVDGDSDSWELQRLAAFGKLERIPPIMYTEVNAARRALINRCYDSGKTVVMTNKLKYKYVDDVNDDGTPKTSKSGEVIKVKSDLIERQGFGDQDYLYQFQLRHLYQPAKTITIEKGPLAGTTKTVGPKWGMSITKCKAQTRFEGTELWGDQCNFQGLVQTVYPHIPLEDWGL